MLIFDRIENEQSNRQITPEGYLSVPANLTRPGVFQYKAKNIQINGDPIDRDPEQFVAVYRPASEVFKEETMKSFALRPITIGHQGMITAKSIKKHQVGVSDTSVARVGEFLRSGLMIMDERGVEAASTGTGEISIGYTADFKEEKGLTELGEPYEYVMYNLKGNHIALVERGRSGPSCRLLDEEEGEKMKKLVLDEVEHEVPEAVAQHVEALQTALQDAKEEAVTAKTGAEAIQASSEKLVADAEEKHQKEVKAMQDSMEKMVEDRLEIIAQAKTLVQDVDPKGKSNDQIVEEVAVKLFDCAELIQDKDEGYKKIYCKALFDSALAAKAKKGDGSDKLKVVQDDSEIPDGDKARKEFLKRTENAYKGE